MPGRLSTACGRPHREACWAATLGAMTAHQTPAWLQVTHELRRAHDDSVISVHCSSGCALEAFERLTLAQIMGNTPPGPLERVEARLVDLATGEVAATAGGTVPPDGVAPPEIFSWP